MCDDGHVPETRERRLILEVRYTEADLHQYPELRDKVQRIAEGWGVPAGVEPSETKHATDWSPGSWMWKWLEIVPLNTTRPLSDLALRDG